MMRAIFWRRNRHESDDTGVCGGGGGSCRRCGDGGESALGNEAEMSAARQRAENRGILWVVGAFVICPCHLPITLGVSAALLGGTAAGVALRGHLFVAGTVITATWLAATWHGIRLMRSAQGAAAGR